ncbi:MAG: DUF2075 domain-containing protein, partial [Elioraea sp.]|nr:DUF2075 domain-containing protein [Elioraea sp.]
AGEVSPRPVQEFSLRRGVAQPLATRYDRLGVLIQEILRGIPTPKVSLDGDAWLDAPYRPVPTIIEAATLLYATHGVAEISYARADAPNLTYTAAAIDRIIEAAKRSRSRFVVFVTGIPGSGKTLCGLNAVFGRARDEGAAFLSGNVPLIAVLRAALVRDAAARGDPQGEAQRRVRAALQNVHLFLEDHATLPERVPPEHIVVFDEAQQAWDEAKARQGTQRRPGRLTMSEAAHMLEIMTRAATRKTRPGRLPNSMRSRSD